MKYTDKKKITIWYSAAIAFTAAISILMLFSYYDLNKSYHKVTEEYIANWTIENIDSELAGVESYLYKNRGLAAFQLCDSVYQELAVKADKLKELSGSDSLKKEKCTAVLNILKEQSNPDNAAASADEKLRGREIREFMEKDRISRLNRPVADLKQLFKRSLNEKNQNYEFRKQIALWAIPASSLLSLIIIFSALITGFRREKTYLKKEAVLIEIAGIAERTKDLNEFFKEIHETIKKNMPAKNFYAALFNSDDESLEFPYFYNEFDPIPETRYHGKGLAEHIIKLKEPLLANYDDLTMLMEEGEIESEGKPAYSWIGVPIMNNGEALGVIAAQSYEQKIAFAAEDVNLLKYAAGQASLAITGKFAAEETIGLKEEIKNSIAELEKNRNEIFEIKGKLTEAEKKVKNLKTSKDKYFSILSHDLRSPFNSLLGFTDILMEDFDDLSPEEIKKYVGIVSGSAHNLLNLIDNLVQWSKLQRNKLEFQPETAKLKGEVNYIFDLMKENAEKKNIVFMNKVGDDVNIFADKTMFHSIMQNLVSNAVKFTAKGGRVVVEASAKKDCTEIIIADTGIGIKKENLDKLFRFEKTFSTKGTENELGSGLGLVLVKELIDKHNGNIKVSSVEGKGTAVFVELPFNSN